MESSPINIALLFELLYLAYIVSYLFIIVNKPIATIWKVVWMVVIIGLPLIGPFFYHNTERPESLRNRRRFNPKFNRGRRP